MGLEPTTSPLPRVCSTTELRWRTTYPRDRLKNRPLRDGGADSVASQKTLTRPIANRRSINYLAQLGRFHRPSGPAKRVCGRTAATERSRSSNAAPPPPVRSATAMAALRIEGLRLVQIQEPHLL